MSRRLERSISAERVEIRGLTSALVVASASHLPADIKVHQSTRIAWHRIQNHASLYLLHTAQRVGIVEGGLSDGNVDAHLDLRLLVLHVDQRRGR